MIRYTTWGTFFSVYNCGYIHVYTCATYCYMACLAGTGNTLLNLFNRFFSQYL